MAQSWRHVAQSDADMAAAMQISGIITRQALPGLSRFECCHAKWPLMEVL